MGKVRRQFSGFTLIELMIVVAIIGVLASVALPTFNNFVMMSKRSEAYSNIGAIYKLAMGYYTQPKGTQGLTGTGSGRCIVSGADPAEEFVPDIGTYGPPTAEKRTINFMANPRFAAIGFANDTPLYYSYVFGTGTTGVEGYCNATSGPYVIYTLAALGDLDGDGKLSGHALYVGINAEGDMYRGPAIYEAPMGFGGGMIRDIE